MRLGDANVDYDDNFRFFMTTKMPNPTTSPKFASRSPLSTSPSLSAVSRNNSWEMWSSRRSPEIEQKRDEIVLSMDADQRTLKQIENTILKLLSESTEEQILDEDTLITVLENSKKTSKEINERIA
jgi:dynein heavy chain